MLLQHDSPLYDNFRKFVRLIPFRADPLQKKYIQDEFDLIYMLDAIRLFVEDTSGFVGKNKYRNETYDFIREIKEATEEWLLVGNNDKETAIFRRKHLAAYHLVIEPIIDSFKQYQHIELLEQYNNIIDSTIDDITNHTIEGTYDDALVANEQIKVMVREKEEQRKASIKKRKSRKNNLEEFLVEEEEETLLDILQINV